LRAEEGGRKKRVCEAVKFKKREEKTASLKKGEKTRVTQEKVLETSIIEEFGLNQTKLTAGRRIPSKMIKIDRKDVRRSTGKKGTGSSGTQEKMW